MSSISKKGAAAPTAAKPGKIMPTNPARLHMSRDQVIAEDRKLREIDAKVEMERQRLEALSNQENEALIAAGTADNNEELEAKEEEIAALKAELEAVKKKKEEIASQEKSGTNEE